MNDCIFHRNYNNQYLFYQVSFVATFFVIILQSLQDFFKQLINTEKFQQMRKIAINARKCELIHMLYAGLFSHSVVFFFCPSTNANGFIPS